MLYFPTKVELLGTEKEAAQFQGLILLPENNSSSRLWKFTLWTTRYVFPAFTVNI